MITDESECALEGRLPAALDEVERGVVTPPSLGQTEHVPRPGIRAPLRCEGSCSALRSSGPLLSVSRGLFPEKVGVMLQAVKGRFW